MVTLTTTACTGQSRNWRVFGCPEAGAPRLGGPAAKITIKFLLVHWENWTNLASVIEGQKI